MFTPPCRFQLSRLMQRSCLKSLLYSVSCQPPDMCSYERTRSKYGCLILHQNTGLLNPSPDGDMGGGMGQGRMRKWPIILVVRCRTVLLALNINEMCRCDLVSERGEKEKQTDCKGDWGKRRKKGRGGGEWSLWRFPTGEREWGGGKRKMHFGGGKGRRAADMRAGEGSTFVCRTYSVVLFVHWRLRSQP